MPFVGRIDVVVDASTTSATRPSYFRQNRARVRSFSARKRINCVGIKRYTKWSAGEIPDRLLRLAVCPEEGEGPHPKSLSRNGRGTLKVA